MPSGHDPIGGIDFPIKIMLNNKLKRDDGSS